LHFIYGVSINYIGERDEVTNTILHCDSPDRPAGDIKITMWTNLNADVRCAAIRTDFAKIADYRANNKKLPMVDVMMSDFAMVSLKDQSLLAFDE
jgi:hypothetical protein